MPLLPPFVFIAPNSTSPDMGAGFVLSTKNPFYLGRIIKLKPDPFAIMNYKMDFKPLIMAEVQDYSIVIAFAGNLTGYKVQVNTKFWEEDLQNIFQDMADFFLRDKIENNAGYYKRYKLI